MTFSLKRALAIFQKDYKDLSRNLFVSSTLIMPLFLAVFYSRIGDGGVDAARRGDQLLAAGGELVARRQPLEEA